MLYALLSPEDRARKYAGLQLPLYQTCALCPTQPLPSRSDTIRPCPTLRTSRRRWKPTQRRICSLVDSSCEDPGRTYAPGLRRLLSFYSMGALALVLNPIASQRSTIRPFQIQRCGGAGSRRRLDNYPHEFASLWCGLSSFRGGDIIPRRTRPRLARDSTHPSY